MTLFLGKPPGGGLPVLSVNSFKKSSNQLICGRGKMVKYFHDQIFTEECARLEGQRKNVPHIRVNLSNNNNNNNLYI